MAEPSVRILGIAPYEAMKTAMERAVEDYPAIRLDVYTGDLEEGVEIVRSCPPDTYDCIISRGGTAELIRRVTDIPVVEIQLSVYDVLRAIKLAEHYSSLYAVVGFPSITEPAHTLCDLLRYDLDILTVHNSEEVHTTLARLQQGGYRMVVCDMVTHTVARQLGLDAFLITSGLESLHGALDQALLLSAGFRRLRQENLFMRSILQEEDGGLAVLTEAGAPYFSMPAEPPPALLAGMRTHILEIPAASALKYYQDEQGVLYRVTGRMVTAGGTRYCVFRYIQTQIPLRAHKAGLRVFSKGECQHLFMNSFYSLSGAMGELDPTVNAIAATRQPVLIAGEVGTGKEQIARAIYLRGPLSSKPFIVINCEAASDKVWDFLLNHYNSPLGGSGCTVYFQQLEALPEARAAELAALILETGLLRRERLLFSCSCQDEAPLPETCQRIAMRLGCLTLRLPSLRSRADEIPSLASLYLGSLNLEIGRQLSGFDPHAIEQLRQFDWPNNYTQFKQVLTELATLATSAYIRSSAVTEVLAKERALMRGVRRAEQPEPVQTLDALIREAIQNALAANDGNQTAAARQLGISRTTLWRHLN